MLRHSLLLLSVSLLGASLACQSTAPAPATDSAGSEGARDARAPAGEPPVQAVDPGSTLPRQEELPGIPAPAFTGFARNAFPPTLSPADYHADGWARTDCLRCHERGRDGTPVVKHEGMSPRLMQAVCRSCHVPEPRGEFAYNAFPPTLPMDSSHAEAWTRTDCLLCHENGVRNAPLVRHAGMSRALLKARCRTCHVPSNRPGQPGDEDQ